MEAAKKLPTPEEIGAMYEASLPQEACGARPFPTPYFEPETWDNSSENGRGDFNAMRTRTNNLMTVTSAARQAVGAKLRENPDTTERVLKETAEAAVASLKLRLDPEDIQEAVRAVVGETGAMMWQMRKN